MGEQVRVFLSSTWSDLQDERAAVEEVLHRMRDAEFNGMEYFGSRPETSREASLAEVDRSDLYIGIFGRRYGSGITEDEYRRARERRLPCLIYILAEDLPNVDDGTTEGSTQVARRDALLRKLQAAHIVTHFRSPVELAARVATDLHRELDNLRPRVTVPMSAEDRDNRSRMLARMGSEVGGRLADALHGTAWIELGLEHRPDAVPPRGGQIIREHASAESSPLSVTDVVDAFDKFDGELLILGAPGAGKTTVLLDLARVLIWRAKRDESQPMPLVFHLASWAANRRPLADWLISELTSPAYDVPQQLARIWVDGDQILPLLDGLDEVAAEHRPACVAAINAYRTGREQRLARLVVCCRLTEYEALPQPQLRSAVLVQPLTEEQIDAYLGVMGEHVDGLRSALRSDGELRGLAAIPLLLNIMVLTYQDAPAEALPVRAPPDERRSEILTNYVERMFVRRVTTASYRPERSIRWLSWLARTLSVQRRDALHLERIQPTWLPTRNARYLYVIADRLVLALVIGVIIRFAVDFMSSMTVGIDPLGITLGLAGALAVAFFGGQDEALGGARDRSWRLGQDLRGAVRGVAVALIAGPLISVISIRADGLPINPTMIVVVGLLGGPIVGLTAALTGWPAIAPRRIAMVETIGWSLPKSVRSGVMSALVVGLAYVALGELVIWLALTSSIPYSPVTFLVYWLPSALWLGLPVGVISGAFGLILGGLTGRQVTERSTPNQGIWRSIKRAIIVGLSAGLSIGLLLGSFVPLASKTRDGTAVLLTLGLASGFVGGLSAGLAVGLAFGMTYGGQAFVSHFVLRFVLWWHDKMPLNYVRFLEYATERIFLRRVGGGYIFIHRLVQEHFAANEEALVARVAGIPTPEK